MKMTVRCVLAFVLLAAAGVQAQQPAQTGISQPKEAAKPASGQTPIPRYLEVSPKVGTGAQPTEAGMKLLAEKGYTSIINFRTPVEMAPLAYEETMAGELGLKYFSLPVQGQAPKEAQAMAFLKLMNALKNEKVFVHCAAANRAGAFMMIYLALQKKMKVDKAETEATKIGMSSETLRRFALEVIARQKKK